jgi:hypothetical protein
MIRKILVAVALAIGALALAMPALQPGLAPCGWGLCTSQTPALLADDEDDWDDDEWADDEWDDGYYDYYQPGPWLSVCAGYDTGIPLIAVGGCSPNLAGP